MQTFVSDASSPSQVALLNCGDNPDSLKIANGLAGKGYDLLLICHPALQEAAEQFRKTVEGIGRQCTVVVRWITSLDFYRQLLTTIYLKFGWVDIYVDYGTRPTEKPTADQAQLSATLLWLYLQFLPPSLKGLGQFMHPSISV